MLFCWGCLQTQTDNITLMRLWEDFLGKQNGQKFACFNKGLDLVLYDAVTTVVLTHQIAESWTQGRYLHAVTEKNCNLSLYNRNFSRQL